MELIKPGTRFDFMGMRKYFYVLSATLFLLSLFAMFVYPRPNWGTDFKGGTEVEVTLVSDKPVAQGQVRSAVESSGFTSAEVVANNTTPNRFLIRVQEVSALSDATKEKLQNTLCYSDSARQDARCPANMQPTELK